MMRNVCGIYAGGCDDYVNLWLKKLQFFHFIDKDVLVTTVPLILECYNAVDSIVRKNVCSKAKNVKSHVFLDFQKKT